MKDETFQGTKCIVTQHQVNEWKKETGQDLLDGNVFVLSQPMPEDVIQKIIDHYGIVEDDCIEQMFGKDFLHLLQFARENLKEEETT